MSGAYQRIVLTILILIANTIWVLAALPDQYKFLQLTSKNGLSHSQINCILKDSRGYIWIGTAAGLNRYDGYQVKVFRHDPNDSLSVSANDINKLFEDPQGNIWISTHQGMTVYNAQTEKFHSNTEDFLREYRLPDYNIEDIVKDDDGNFWFLQTGHGVTRYNPKDKSSINLRFSSKPTTHAISSNHVSALQQDSKGNFWLMHRNGMLEKLDGNSLQVIESHDDIYQQFNHELHFYGLSIDSDDDLWIYQPFDRRGVFYFNHARQTIQHFHKNSDTLQLNTNLVSGVVENTKGEIWIGTDHGGINVIHKDDFSVDYILHNAEVENGLAHNSIYALYKDDQGIIWIGTYKNGVNYYHKNIIRFPHHKHLASQNGSLPYDDLNRFVEDNKGNLWIGTNGGGLLYLNRTTGEYTRFRHDPANPNTISSDVMVSLHYDQKKDVLWIGTYFGGLNKFDGKNFTHYRKDPNDPGSLADDNIWELLQDSKGNLWVGTLSTGLELYNDQEEKIHHFQGGDGPEAISTNYILALEEDSQGNIWVGGSYGLDIINQERSKRQHFLNEPDNPGSLNSNTILDIYRDSKNRMWVASQEGLSLYNPEENNFRHFTMQDGLPHNMVLTILEDDQHNLWLGTPNGISHLILTEESNGLLKAQVKNYDESDGLQGMIFNENAALKTSNGELIFGGSNGFNIFSPESIEENKNIPQLVFTDFQLFNKSLEAGKRINGRVVLPKSLSQTERITLKHDENVFSIGFAALNFFQPEKNTYKYKLEGFDKEWRMAEKNIRQVSYTNLDPGEYQFKVQAANNDGVWNEEGISMQIAVLAPFWRTKTAYACYVLLIVAAIYAGRRRTIKRASAKFRIEQERREARQMHELDLMKIRFFTNVSHEFRTPLSLILAPLEKLMSITDDQQQNRQFQMIQRNAKRLLNLVNQLLDFRKLEVEGISFYPSEGNLIRFIEEAVNSFSDLSEKKNILLSFQSDKQALNASFDMDKLEKILFNLLSNAFKFTPENGKIEVLLSCREGDSLSEGLQLIEIKVRDTGIGIPEDKQEKVFERFFRNDVPNSLVNQGSGIGLSITKEFVKIHGGTIQLESTPGQGSCFTVSIPVKEIKKAGEVSTESPESRKEEYLMAVDKTEVVVKKNSSYAKNEKREVILLVEDNEDFRFYLKDNLGIHFKIIEAKNGKEGWQKALSAMPDLIVSDLMMPEINGIDFCKKVKNDPRTSHMPFVLLTAHTAEEKKLKGLDIGANDYITKPFNFEILLSRIRNLIHQRQQLQQVFEKKISVQSSEVEIISLDDKLIQNAIKIVEERLSDPDLSVQLLSRELAMSRAGLYNKILALTGSSPAEFIRRIRLQHAAQLLEKSQLSVAEVAYQVGFNNAKYFSRYFKEEYKVLPSLYARHKQEQIQ